MNQAMPLPGAQLGQLVIRKSLKQSRFIINDILRQRLEPSPSSFKATKCSKYEGNDTIVLRVRLVVLAIIISKTYVNESSQKRRDIVNRQKLQRS